MRAVLRSVVRSPLVALLLGAGTLAPALAAAQDLQADPVQVTLTRELRPGDTVTVTERDGQRVKGRLLEVTPDVLALRVQDQRHDVSLKDIHRVQRTRMGIVLGTAIGAGVGLALGSLGASVSDADMGAGDVILITAVGAGAGLGIDALVNFPRTVYRRTEVPRVSIAPAVRPGGGSVAVAVRF